MPSVCILLSNGFEELEAVTIADVLRRGDIETVLVGVDGPAPQGSHGIRIGADVGIDEIVGRDWDMVILPGGMPGAARLRDDPRVATMLRRQNARGAKIAAICAAPIALAAAGVLDGKRATCYPGFHDQLGAAEACEDPVVTDDNVTTSRGPGTALAFALALVAQLCGASKAKAIADGMLVVH